MRVAIATYPGKPEQFADDDVLCALLRERGVEAEQPTWDDASTDWDAYDLVVARSPWDYTWRLEEFLTWTDRVGDRLENAPAVIRWNSDKHYLADLFAMGIDVVETTYVEPGEPAPDRSLRDRRQADRLRRGARLGALRARPPAARPGADRADHGRRPHGDGPAVPRERRGELGETAVVLIAGEVSHVLRKASILRPDEVAPVRTDDAARRRRGHVRPRAGRRRRRDPEELELASKVRDAVAERFGAAAAGDARRHARRRRRRSGPARARGDRAQPLLRSGAGGGRAARRGDRRPRRGVTPLDLVRRRMAVQRLTARPARSAAEVVRGMGAVQAQEMGEVTWSLAERMEGEPTDSAVAGALPEARSFAPTCCGRRGTSWRPRTCAGCSG